MLYVIRIVVTRRPHGHDIRWVELIDNVFLDDIIVEPGAFVLAPKYLADGPFAIVEGLEVCSSFGFITCMMGGGDNENKSHLKG